MDAAAITLSLTPHDRARIRRPLEKVWLPLIALLISCSGWCWAQKMEPNTDRPGMDIRDFDQPANSLLCYNACRDDQECRSFSFRKPMDGRSAHCWIKRGVPPARFDERFVSGVVRGEPAIRPVSAPSFEPNTDRMGADIRDFDLPANSLLCYNACRDDQRCRSFTFKKPLGASAHCWIKSGIPVARYDTAFVSGVVRP